MPVPVGVEPVPPVLLDPALVTTLERLAADARAWYAAVTGVPLRDPVGAVPVAEPVAPDPPDSCIPAAARPFVERCPECPGVRTALERARGGNRKAGVHVGLTVTCGTCRDTGLVLTQAGRWLASVLAGQPPEELPAWREPLAPPVEEAAP